MINFSFLILAVCIFYLIRLFCGLYLNRSLCNIALKEVSSSSFWYVNSNFSSLFLYPRYFNVWTVNQRVKLLKEKEEKRLA